MKLTDYMIDFLAKMGIRHTFLVSGGAVMHLVDSVARHPEMEVICAQHEQNGAAAADGYARVRRDLGLVMGASGPGATNMLTSVCNAFYDSVPLLCLTGQVARNRLRTDPRLRQRGFQESDVVGIFSAVTKYAKLVCDPSEIRCELEKAVYYAKEGRPGPVVLDLPEDLQREEIDPSTLRGFTPPKESQKSLPSELFLANLRLAKRPLLLFGAGVHQAHAEEEARAFARRWQLPVTLTWGAAALFDDTDPLNMGRVGTYGTQAGNYALERADCIIAIGTRLSQMITGSQQEEFAPLARKIMIDIDIAELEKFGESPFSLDLAICADLLRFLQKVLESQSLSEDRYTDWRKEIHAQKVEESPQTKKQLVSPSTFMKTLSPYIPRNAIMVGDSGANLSWLMQAFAFQEGQTMFSAWNHTPMGYALPASVGAALASSRPVYCWTGDGGLMMALEELATLHRYNLPVRLFVASNGGHTMQKQTIETWLESHYVAVDHASGLCFPSYEKLAEAFDLPYFCIKNNEQIEPVLKELTEKEGPFFCDVRVDPDARIKPVLSSGQSFDDLMPPVPDRGLDSLLDTALV